MISRREKLTKSETTHQRVINRDHFKQRINSLLVIRRAIYIHFASGGDEQREWSRRAAISVDEPSHRREIADAQQRACCTLLESDD